jgi:hypothetical protein
MTVIVNPVASGGADVTAIETLLQILLFTVALTVTSILFEIIPVTRVFPKGMVGSLRRFEGRSPAARGPQGRERRRLGTGQCRRTGESRCGRKAEGADLPLRLRGSVSTPTSPSRLWPRKLSAYGRGRAAGESMIRCSRSCQRKLTARSHLLFCSSCFRIFPILSSS